MTKKKVLMVVTSVDAVPGTDIRTGFFLRELTHPYYEVHEAGWEIDIASPTGGPAHIDPHSDPREPGSKVQDDIISMGFLNSPMHAAKLKDTLRLAQVGLSDYAAIYFAGGAGAIFDLPSLPETSRSVAQVWEAGGVVGAACHGSSALLNIKLSDGSWLVQGAEVTGLSSVEEDNIHRQIPAFQTPIYMEAEFPERGATFRKLGPDVPFALTSGNGRLVTGQNNASGTLVGKRLVEALAAAFPAKAAA